MGVLTEDRIRYQDGVITIWNGNAWVTLQSLLQPLFFHEIVSVVIGAGDQPSIGTSSTALTGFTSGAFTAVAGHKYGISYTLSTSQQTTAPATHTIDWQLAGVDQAIISTFGNIAVSQLVTHSGFIDLGSLGGAGSKTISLSGRTSVSTMTVANASANNGRFAVYDLGT